MHLFGSPYVYYYNTDIIKSCVVYEFSCRCEVRYVGRTTQRLADRIKQHVPTSIRKKSNTVREQPPRLCKNNNSKINCESAIGQHLLTNPECAKTYTDDNFRIIGQGRSSFHLSVLESCVNRKISSSLLESSSNNGNWANWPLLGPLRPRAHGSGSIWVWSQTGADRPCVHTRPPLSDPVWVCYPY